MADATTSTGSYGQANNPLLNSIGRPISETDLAYAGQTVGLYAQAAGGVQIPQLGDRSTSLGGSYVPDDNAIASIAKANQLTGNVGAQAMAGNLAINAATGVQGAQGGTTGSSFNSNGVATQPIIKTTAQDDNNAILTIMSEAAGKPLIDQVHAAENIRNRTLAYQDGSWRKLGLVRPPSPDVTVSSVVQAPAQYSGWNPYSNGGNHYTRGVYTAQEYQIAAQAWEVAKSGSNTTKGAPFFNAPYLGNVNGGSGSYVVATDSSHSYYTGPNGATYSNPALSNNTQIPNIAPGNYVQNNVKMNNTAQIMKAQGHAGATTAEVAMTSMYPPQVAQAWARAFVQKKHHKTVQELIKEGGQDAAAWQMFASQYSGKVSHASISPVELMKIWLHTFFKPHKSVGAQKWNIIQNLNTGFASSGINLFSLASAISPGLASSISSINNVWGNLGPDGPIAHAMQNALVDMMTPAPPQQPNISNPAVAPIAQGTSSQTVDGNTSPFGKVPHALTQNLTAITSSAVINALAFPGATNFRSLSINPLEPTPGN